MKTIYAVLILAFIGFGGLVWYAANDMHWAAYSHAFIAAYACNIFWLQKKLG